MGDVFDRCWRTFGTALSFAAFGLGGLLLRLLVFPPLRLFTRDPGTLPADTPAPMAIADPPVAPRVRAARAGKNPKPDRPF